MRLARKATLTLLSTVALAAVVSLISCAPGTPPEDAPAVLRMGHPGVEGNFLPGSMSADGFAGLVYDSLFDVQKDGSINPNLATEWHYNEDNTVLSVTLRDDVFFTDGTSLDAQDVVATIEYYPTRPEIYMPNVKSAQATGDRTVEITMLVASHKALPVIGELAIASSEGLANPDSLVGDPIGTGPYVVDEEASVDGTLMVFERNSDYWNPAAWGYDRIELSLLSDITARITALKTEAVDLASVDAATARTVEASGYHLDTSHIFWKGLFINDLAGRVVPALGDLRVRQAMMMAIDRDEIARQIDLGLGRSSNQIFDSTSPAYRPDRADEYAFDPVAARELLAEAGYPDGFDLTMPNFIGLSSDYGPYVHQALADIGIRVTYEDHNQDSWLAAYTSPSTTMVLVVGPFTDLTEDLAANGFWNGAGTDVAQPIIDRINAAKSEGEAQAAWADLGDLMLDEAWIIPVGQPPTVFASKGIDITFGYNLLNWRGIQPAA